MTAAWKRGARGSATVVLLCVLAASCSAGPQGPPRPSNRQLVSAVSKAGGLSVTLRSTPAVAAAGATFSLTLDLRNLSGKTLTFDLPSSQEYEFLAFERGGEEVWRWSEGVLFAQARTKVLLAPGENVVYKVAWNAADVPEGLYTVQGYFLGLPGTAPAVTVEIGGN